MKIIQNLGRKIRLFAHFEVRIIAHFILRKIRSTFHRKFNQIWDGE